MRGYNSLGPDHTKSSRGLPQDLVTAPASPSPFQPAPGHCPGRSTPGQAGSPPSHLQVVLSSTSQTLGSACQASTSQPHRRSLNPDRFGPWLEGRPETLILAREDWGQRWRLPGVPTHQCAGGKTRLLAQSGSKQLRWVWTHSWGSERPSSWAVPPPSPQTLMSSSPLFLR